NRDTDLMVGLIYYSDDAGLTWGAFNTPEGDFDLLTLWQDAAYSPTLDMIVACGLRQASPGGETAGSEFDFMYSSNGGSTWTGVSVTDFDDYGCWNRVIWCASINRFVAIEGNPNVGNAKRIATSSDGINWTIQGGAPSDAEWFGLA